MLAGFNQEAAPSGYLLRPLLACLALSVVIGAVSLVAGRYAVVASAAVALVVMKADLVGVLIAAIAVTAVQVARITRSSWVFARPVLYGSAVFLLSGVAFAVPNISFSGSEAQSIAAESSPPIYLVLLDGYPRNDTLVELGIDNTSFVEALSQRGFDHYPDAQSNYSWTHLTITELLGGSQELENELGSPFERRQLQESWRLPDGFVTISSPVAHTKIPNAPDIGPGGINDFEVRLLGRSAFSPFVGDLIMSDLRRRLDRSLSILSSTTHRRVFAHLFAPHLPLLYEEDGSPRQVPTCWPVCVMFNLLPEGVGMTTQEWVAGLRTNLGLLNSRLLEAVDAILAHSPDAVIVLFSDHGARYSLDDADEWYRTFLAARTPGHPKLFADEPSPAVILERVLESY